MAGTMVSFQANGGTSSGYLAVTTSGKGLGIIVMQEWWGLVNHIKDVCDRFATAGFTALAPDLYNGKTTKSLDEAGKMMMALNIGEAEKTIKGAIQYLLQQPTVSSEKVGSVGFCMGGQLALFAATLNPKIGTTVDFYGIHPHVKPDYSRLAGPVLGLFAEKDDLATPDAIAKLKKDIAAAGKSIETHVYPGTTHAFFNDTRPQVHYP